jgi:hypothetical protein
MDAWGRWQNGEHIQIAAPTLSVGEREQLISGMHSDCFDKLFPEET